MAYAFIYFASRMVTLIVWMRRFGVHCRIDTARATTACPAADSFECHHPEYLLAQIDGVFSSESPSRRAYIEVAAEPRLRLSVRHRPQSRVHPRLPSPLLPACSTQHEFPDTRRAWRQVPANWPRTVCSYKQARSPTRGYPSCAAHGRAIPSTLQSRAWLRHKERHRA